MSPPDPEDLARLSDMILYAERAIRHLGNTPPDQFVSDEKTFDSVVRCLQVVGEAAWKVSRDIQQAHPEVEWLLIAGMRHRLVHDYGEVDPGIAHRAVTNHLPDLLSRLRVILSDYEDGGRTRADTQRTEGP